MFLKKTDSQVYKLIEDEKKRRREGLEMIPSENHTSPSVLEALGSILTDKYAEGYPGRRYYGGNEVVDKVENLAIERAKKAFGVPYVNIQPYSGSPANFAVYVATCENGDTIMGQDLSHGGHLTHGAKASATSRFFKSIPYHVTPEGKIDIEEIRRSAREFRPKLMWVGATAYPRILPFKEIAEIADEVGAYLAADIAHVAGLVVGKAHPSPVPFVHIVTTTTHKTLRGPRGGMIMVTEKGLKKDPDLPAKIDKAVFPGLQGGPHEHQIAAIAVALKEAMTPAFVRYSRQVVLNTKALAKELMSRGVKLVSNGTENHLLLLDLTPSGIGKGIFLEKALDAAGITVNKNTIPGEPSSPFYPSGVRMGTPAITTRGMKEKEMKIIGGFIARVVNFIKDYQLPLNKEARAQYLQKFRQDIKKSKEIKEIKQSVLKLGKKFPIPAIN
jgi:glycine hydroxymethyltransferase